MGEELGLGWGKWTP